MKTSVPQNFSRRARRLAIVVAGVATIAPIVGHGVAQADTQVRLPGQTVSKKLADGTTLTITRSRESARINPSLGGTPLHRNAWVSGRYDVTSSDKKARFGIGSGYIVGCQLTLGGKSTSQGNATPNMTEGTVTATAQTGGSVTIGPGQAATFFVNDREYQDPFGGRAHDQSIKFSGGEGAVSYTNATMMINGCAGYAQARSFAKVQIMTEHTTQVVWMYGKPFSLG
ncbi:MspA family porin [Gordonia sp. CPCC 205515]|uniref:MspA family porin n=1 Tax=Gordonia sp. CPCC 205515 TaxID=3140791 RepID=UPI003AF34815